MLVFNDRHFLRHISMPTLREFTQQHKISPKLNIDWEAAADTLHALVGKELDRLEESLVQGGLEVARNGQAADRRTDLVWPVQ